MREKVNICRFFLAVTSVTDDVPLVEFMYHIFTHMPAELPQATQVFVVVVCISSAN